MSEHHLHLKPHPIDQFAWWYEEPEGVCVVLEARKPNGELLSSEQRTITWRTLEAALKRWRKP